MTPKSSPDWLPAGWTVQYRVQKTGRKIEYYLNSSTGQKFFSKNELIQHLRIQKLQLSDPQSTSAQSSSSDKSPLVQTPVRANDDHEWLPDGWVVEVKTYQNGPKIGARYTTYIDPSKRVRLYSKPQVLRFLKDPKSESPMSGQEKHESPISNEKKQESPVSNQKQESPFSMPDVQPEWLPEGWIAELKAVQKGPKRGTRYMTYRNLSTGTRFYSKPEVLRYLKKAKKESPIPNQEEHESSISNKGKQDNPLFDQEKPESNEGKQESPILDKENEESPVSDQEMQDIQVSNQERRERPISDHEKPESNEGKQESPILEKENQESPISDQEMQESPVSNHEKPESNQEKQGSPILDKENQESPISDHEKQESSLSKPDVHPEWLPDGWVVELKTFQKGPKKGRHYKTYLNLSTGSRFLSMPEVLRYLKKAKKESPIPNQQKKESSVSNQGKQDNPISDQEKAESNQEKQESPTLDKENRESPISDQEMHDIPVSIQERQESSVIDKEKPESNQGKQESPILDKENRESPISDQEMQDIPVSIQERQESSVIDKEKQENPVPDQEMQESPVSGQEKQESPVSDQEKQETSISSLEKQESPISNQVRNAADDDLPPGWVKTVKIRKSTKKKDPYYTSPVTDYVFRSKLDVLRFVETGKISKHAFLSKNWNNANEARVDDGTSPLPVAKVDSREKGTENFSDAKTNNSSYSTGEKDSELPRRSSKRLSGAEPELVGLDIALESVTRSSKSKATIGQASTDMTASSGKEKENNIPRRSSQRLSRLAPDVRANSLSSERVPGPAAGNSLASQNLEGDSSNATSIFHQRSSNKSKKPLKGKKAVAEKAQKEKSETLTGAIPLEDATKLGKTTVQRGNGKKTTPSSRKSKRVKKNKEVNLPQRSSKRLAELISESDVDSRSSKKARNSRNKEKTVEDAEKLPNVSFGEHDPVAIGLRHDSTHTTTALPEELSSKNEGLPRGDTFYATEWIKVDDGKLSNKNSEPELRSPPSLEFAVKTLTGTSFEDATTKWLVFGPSNITQELNKRNASSASAKKATTPRKPYKSKPRKKKELDLPRQSSKQRSKEATELVINSIPTETTIPVAKDEKGKEPLQPQSEKPDSDKTYGEKSKPDFLFPSGDTWGDPCLEFAFKTLTGAIAVEDNGTVQDYFQQQRDTSTTKKDGNFTYPDLNLPNFFNSQQQVNANLNPPGIPPANASFPSVSGLSPQQQAFLELRNCPRK